MSAYGKGTAYCHEHPVVWQNVKDPLPGFGNKDADKREGQENRHKKFYQSKSCHLVVSECSNDETEREGNEKRYQETSGE